MTSISKQDEKHIQEKSLEISLNDIRSTFIVIDKKLIESTTLNEIDITSY